MKRLDAGPQDHQHAEKAEHDRADAARGHALAEEQAGAAAWSMPAW